MLQVSDLHRQAQARLAQTAGNPKKLVLLHTAIALGCSVLMSVITYLFSRQIADTGGLGGLGMRSVLATAQSVLELVITMALPFWQMGIFYAALQWVNEEDAGLGSLLQGFRRFSSVLGKLFLQGGLFFGLGIAIFYISTAVFMMTSFATPIVELFAPIMEQGATPEQLESLLTPELMESASRAAVPLLVIFIILYAAAAIPVFYRLRFASFAVMEGLSGGKALLKSFAITRKNCWQIFRLDLSFWWFYLLQVLSVAVCYADTILPAVGISLPVSGVGAAFLFYALGTLCQGVLLWQKEGHRLTAYCLAYRTLDTPSEENSVAAQD